MRNKIFSSKIVYFSIFLFFICFACWGIKNVGATDKTINFNGTPQDPLKLIQLNSGTTPATVPIRGLAAPQSSDRDWAATKGYVDDIVLGIGTGDVVGLWRDTGTYIYNTNSGNIGLATVSGKVGIGTAIPSQLLSVGASNQFTVNGTGVVTASSFNGSVNASNVTNGIFGSALTGYGNYYFYKDASTPILTIYGTNGNVGIGTTIPSQMLSVGATNQFTVSSAGVVIWSGGGSANANTAYAHKTTEDAINGLVKVNGSGTYSAVTDGSTNWNTAYGWGNWAHTTLAGYGITDAAPLAHKTTEDAINGLVKVNGSGTYSAVIDGSTNWNTAYTHSTTDADTSITNEIQTLGTNANTITLTSGGSVTAPYATTAGALAANGANCSAGNYPLGVDASGAVESCTAISISDGDWTISGNDQYSAVSGKVGIGVTAPVYKLSVVESAANALKIPQIIRQTDVDNSGSAVGLGFAVNDVEIAKSAVIYERTAAWDLGKLHFALSSTADNTTAVTLANAKMTIQNDGKVGIGVTSPETALQTTGVITASGMGRFKGWTVAGETGAAAEIGLSAGTGYIYNYNRTTSAHGDFQFGDSAGGALVKAGGNVIINEGSGNDVDFRVEGATDANLLLTDGSVNKVIIGTSGVDYGKLHVNGAISSIITSDTKDLSTWPNVNANYQFSSGSWGIRQGTDDSFNIDQWNGGAEIPAMTIGTTGNVTLNEDSADTDFRVESNDNANMLFVDGGANAVTVGYNGSLGSKFNVYSATNNTTQFTGHLLNVRAGDGTTNTISEIDFGVANTVAPVIIGSKVIDGAGATKGDFYIGTRDSTDGATLPTERLRVTTAGKVGIGTTNPQAYLDITGSNAATNSLRLRSGDNNTAPADSKQILLSWNGGALYTHNIRTRHNAGAPAGNAIDFYTWNHGTDAIDTTGTKHLMTLDGTGNVGIGSTTPIQTLDVNGRMNVTDGVIQRGGAALTGTSDLGLYSQLSGNWVRIVSNAADINFFTDGGIGTTPKLTIASGGNVGIGTNVPQADLHIYKQGGMPKIKLEAAGLCGAGSGIDMGCAGSLLSTSGGLQIKHVGGLYFNTNEADRMMIDVSGNVGIGTGNPQSSLDLGTKDNGSRQYLQIDSESGAPASADCDAVGENGRMVMDYYNDRLYICNQLSGRGWDYISLSD
ncbi:MAG: hypothetical protein WC697_00210 [Patescibacteria group bacterium]|jgi:hypothetical protein